MNYDKIGKWFIKNIMGHAANSDVCSGCWLLDPEGCGCVHFYNVERNEMYELKRDSDCIKLTHGDTWQEFTEDNHPEPWEAVIFTNGKIWWKDNYGCGTDNWEYCRDGGYKWRRIELPGDKND